MVLWLSSTALGGVWVRREGETYLQLSYAWLGSTRTFDEDGRVLARTDGTFVGSMEGLFAEGTYASHDLAFYGEVGLGHGLEVATSLPVRFARAEWTFAEGSLDPVVQRNAGATDWTSTIRAGGPVGRVVLSGAASVRLPLYDNHPNALHVEVGNSDFYDDRVALGPGTIDLDVTAAAGVGTGLLDGWALAEGGLRARNRGFSEAVIGRIQLGVKPVERLAAWVGADGSASLANGPAPDAFLDPWGKGPLAIDAQSWLSAGLGAQVDAGGGLAPFVALSRVLAGLRTPLATTLGGGLAWHGGGRR